MSSLFCLLPRHIFAIKQKKPREEDYMGALTGVTQRRGRQGYPPRQLTMLSLGPEGNEIHSKRCYTVTIRLAETESRGVFTAEDGKSRYCF